MPNEHLLAEGLSRYGIPFPKRYRKSMDDDDMTTGNVLDKVIEELSVKCCSNRIQEEFNNDSRFKIKGADSSDKSSIPTVWSIKKQCPIPKYSKYASCSHKKQQK